MSNKEYYEEYLEQSSRQLLGLSPNAQLTRTLLKMAFAREEKIIEDVYADAVEKNKRKEWLYDAYMHLMLVMKFKKSAKQREFEELYEEAMQHNPTYKPPAPKKKPVEVRITNNLSTDGFFLLKGTIKDIEEMFGQWLIINKLLAQDFSWEVNAIQGVKNAFVLRMRGPAEGPHAERLGEFFQELIRNGYIAPRENLNAPPLVPTAPRPGAAKRKRPEEEEEEQQQQKKPRGLGIPKPFAVPKPGEK